MKKVMKCKKCGNDKFMFEWRFKDEHDQLMQFINHDGWGFQFEDSYIACSKCKKFVKYENQNFITLKEEKNGKTNSKSRKVE